jgi:aspartate racemase
MYKETIGIIGGFGGFATIDFFQRLLTAFNTGCERDIPHILMDNDFTMPSRTRALLYGTDYSVIVEAIARSMNLLIGGGADYIILPCGTSHAFLKDVFVLCPEGRNKVLSILDALGADMRMKGVKSASVIAAEGTLKQHVFSKALAAYGIDLHEPGGSDYGAIRTFIEAVKQQKLNDETAFDFVRFLKRQPDKVLSWVVRNSRFSCG